MALEPSLAAAADQDFPQPRFANVVSTVNLGCKLNLLQIVMKARNAEYTPGRFPAVIMRIREPKTTCLIFSSGKLVITGAKSVQASRMAATRYRNIVKKVGFSEAKFKDFRIQNIVASCDVNFPIRLEALNLTGGDSKYEPEIFPGLIYKVLKPSVVFLIFASGKVVITGAKNFENETLKAWDLMYPLIALHRRAVVPRAIVQPKITATKTGKNKCS